MATIQTHFDRGVNQVATGGDDAWSEQTVQRIAVKSIDPRENWCLETTESHAHDSVQPRHLMIFVPVRLSCR